MRILFLDRSHPAHFRHIVPYLAASGHYDVAFLSEYKKKEQETPGVRYSYVRYPTTANKQNIREQTFLSLARRAEAFGSAMEQLRVSGFEPDVIYANASSACGFFAPQIFSKAPLILGLDWYFNRKTDQSFFEQGISAPIPADFAPLAIRNLFQVGQLTACTVALTNTSWQRDNFPPEHQKKIHVMHEGINTDYFTPGSNSVQLDDTVLGGGRDLVTYISRTLSPYGGFETFYKSLPSIVKARKYCHVLIVGRSIANEGSEEESYLKRLMREIPVDSSRIHFLDFCNYEEYRAIIRASSVHVFMTAPLALPSSLLDIMSCASLVVASDTPPVTEIIKHQHNGLLTDFWDSEALAQTIIHALENKNDLTHLAQEARETILKRFSTSVILPKQEQFILKILQQSQEKDTDENTP